MDWIIILFIILVPLFCLIASVYFFAHYSHSQEQDFAKSWFTRIFTIFIILFGMLQQFFIALDLANQFSGGHSGTVVTLFSVYYITLAVFLFLILPFSTFYYETSEETSVYFRVRKASFKSMMYFLVVALVLIVSFFGFNTGAAFTYYIIGFFMIIGWILLFYALGVGFVAVPFDLIYEFITRPQPIQKAEFETRKKILLDNLLLLRKRWNDALDERIKINNEKYFKRWWNDSRLTRKVASIHCKSLILEREYIRLVKLSKFNKYIEPISYYFKLILGILAILVNIGIFVQILGCQILNANDLTGCSYDFLSLIVRNLSDNSVGLGAVSTAIILFLSMYLLGWAWYGNNKLGIRFVIYTYAPMSPRETLYNNIWYNVFLLNLWSAAITQLLIQAFKSTITDPSTDSAWNDIFFEHINNFRVHREMYKYSVFIYMTLAVSFIYFIYAIIFPNDLKVVLKKNESYMKSLANKRDKIQRIEEPLIDQ